METFYHPIGFRVETSGSSIINSQRFTDSDPDEGCELWTEVKRAGAPKHEIQVEIKASAQDSADMEVNGVASGQKVVWSVIVIMYDWSEAEGRWPHQEKSEILGQGGGV